MGSENSEVMHLINNVIKIQLNEVSDLHNLYE